MPYTSHTSHTSQDELEKDTRRRLRKTIINAILCTDMSNHFAMTQEFRKHDAEVWGGEGLTGQEGLGETGRGDHTQM